MCVIKNVERSLDEKKNIRFRAAVQDVPTKTYCINLMLNYPKTICCILCSHSMTTGR